MNLEQALAILVVTAFAAFVVWGRTAGGRKALGRLMPPTETPRKRSTAKRSGGTRSTAPVKRK